MTTISGQVANVSIGLILLFALGSLGIYGFIVGGWASDSKYSLLGSMRTCAQLVEESLALSVSGRDHGQLALLVEIVDEQRINWWFALPQFVGLIVFFIAGVAETNRALRPPRGRDRARRRLSHRVQRHAPASSRWPSTST